MPDNQTPNTSAAHGAESAQEAARMDVVRQNLRIAIAIKGTTAAEVSAAAGLSKNSLGAFLRGVTSIGYANLFRICDILSVPIGVLHRPGGVTPERIRLHGILKDVPPEVLARALEALDDLEKGQ